MDTPNEIKHNNKGLRSSTTLPAQTKSALPFKEEVNSITFPSQEESTMVESVPQHHPTMYSTHPQQHPNVMGSSLIHNNKVNNTMPENGSQAVHMQSFNKQNVSNRPMCQQQQNAPLGYSQQQHHVSEQQQPMNNSNTSVPIHPDKIPPQNYFIPNGHMPHQPQYYTNYPYMPQQQLAPPPHMLNQQAPFYHPMANNTTTSPPNHHQFASQRVLMQHWNHSYPPQPNVGQPYTQVPSVLIQQQAPVKVCRQTTGSSSVHSAPSSHSGSLEKPGTVIETPSCPMEYPIPEIASSPSSRIPSNESATDSQQDIENDTKTTPPLESVSSSGDSNMQEKASPKKKEITKKQDCSLCEKSIKKRYWIRDANVKVVQSFSKKKAIIGKPICKSCYSKGRKIIKQQEENPNMLLTPLSNEKRTDDESIEEETIAKTLECLSGSSSNGISKLSQHSNYNLQVDTHDEGDNIVITLKITINKNKLRKKREDL